MRNSYKRFSIALVLGLALAACGGPLKYNVPSSSRAPGADATVIADVKQDQGQTELEVNAQNLPPPSRVTEGATTFVVWQRKNSGSQWSRLGGLKYDEGDRKGTWKGSVPETAFDLAISSEKEADVASPSGDTVFSQRVEKN